MKVLALTRYGWMGASSRYRTYQYLPYLRDHGFEITTAPLLDDTYLRHRYSDSKTSKRLVARSYLRRILTMRRSQAVDLIWIEKEAFPWVPGWLEALLMENQIPYVVDYDDAWFHRYDHHRLSPVKIVLRDKIGSVMRNAALVVAGNNYLADHAQRAGARRVEVLPTVVDLDHYPHVSPSLNGPTFTVGWIGTPMTAHYLEAIRPVLHELCQDGVSRVVAIGAGALTWNDVPVEVWPWRHETEMRDLQQFDVGIMPLEDSPWEHGKCGLKILQYLVSGRPTVATPVGANKQIVTNGVNGFLASSHQEWLDALVHLKQNPSVRASMGQAGRALVETEYSLQVSAPQLAQLLRSVKWGSHG